MAICQGSFPIGKDLIIVIQFWKYDKKNSLFWSCEKTKAKKYIEETIYDTKDPGISNHTFALVIEGTTIYNSVTYTFYCGFDRGPKKQRILHDIWNKV